TGDLLQQRRSVLERRRRIKRRDGGALADCRRPGGERRQTRLRERRRWPPTGTGRTALRRRTGCRRTVDRTAPDLRGQRRRRRCRQQRGHTDPDVTKLPPPHAANACGIPGCRIVKLTCHDADHLSFWHANATGTERPARAGTLSELLSA